MTDGLVGVNDKRLNGMYHWSILRQIHVVLAGSNLRTRTEKIQLFETCDLCYQVLEGIHNPVPKTNGGAREFQTLSTEFARLIVNNRGYTLSPVPGSESKGEGRRSLIDQAGRSHKNLTSFSLMSRY